MSITGKRNREIKSEVKFTEQNRTNHGVMTAEEMWHMWPERDWIPPTFDSEEPKAADRKKSVLAPMRPSGMMQLMARWVPDGDGDLLCVICDDDKALPFQDAAAFMQTVLKVENGWNSIEMESWERGSRDAPSELDNHVFEVDKAFGEELRCFGIATLREGTFAGMRAIGLGSNKKRIQRAAAIAMVLTALSSPSLLPVRDSCKDLWDAFQAEAPAAASSRSAAPPTGTATAVTHGRQTPQMEKHFIKAWRSTLLERKLLQNTITENEFFAQHPDGKKQQSDLPRVIFTSWASTSSCSAISSRTRSTTVLLR